jgi:hypothetical protein
MSADLVLDDSACPKCGVEMEPIDSDVEGLTVEHLRLCPVCYLVTWSDRDGIHMRQGVPVHGVPEEPGSQAPGGASWSAGEPKKC